MAQKTIGSFIAVLRKANGMTQKELAEKLNVSDKAVSRWERDESAPDLMLIPVIAEIFGITADELLRGERASQRRTEETQAAKTDKQLEFLLSSNETKLKIRSIISSGVAVIGLVAAMICNSALLRASLGFFVGCIFYIAAAVCEACFAVAAFSAINSADFDKEKITEHKTKLKRIIVVACAVILIMFTATLPLLLGDVYVGIDEGDWFLYALIYLAVLAAAAVFISWVVRFVMIKKGKIQASQAAIKRNELKIKTAIITAAVLALSGIAHAGIYSAVPVTTWAPYRVFESVEEFKNYIETPAEYDYYNYQIYEAQTMYIENTPTEDYYTDYEQEWQEILEQNEEIVYGENGEELFRYSHLNELVKEIHFGEGENKLPIHTYTDSDFREGQHMKNLFISVPFILLYIIELSAAFIIYRKRRTAADNAAC